MAQQTVSVSMNGLRRNLHSSLKELKEQLEPVLCICDDFIDVDTESLAEAFNDVARLSNGLNCVWVSGVESFDNMENVYLPCIGEEEGVL